MAQIVKLMGFIDTQLDTIQRRFTLVTGPEHNGDVFSFGCDGLAAPCRWCLSRSVKTSQRCSTLIFSSSHHRHCRPGPPLWARQSSCSIYLGPRPFTLAPTRQARAMGTQSRECCARFAPSRTVGHRGKGTRSCGRLTNQPSRARSSLGVAREPGGVAHSLRIRVALGGGSRLRRTRRQRRPAFCGRGGCRSRARGAFVVECVLCARMGAAVRGAQRGVVCRNLGRAVGGIPCGPFGLA